MAKKKAISYGDILTKLTQVFPRDIYIVHNKYVVSGNIGEAITVGKYLSILSNECTEVFDTVLSHDAVYYISDLKKYKADVKNGMPDSCFLWKVDAKDDYNLTSNRVRTTVDSMLAINEWSEFKFSDEELSDIFDNRKSVEIFEDAPVRISKSIFPSVRKQDMDHVYYHRYNAKDGIAKFVVAFDKELFQSFFIFNYIIL